MHCVGPSVLETSGSVKTPVQALDLQSVSPVHGKVQVVLHVAGDAAKVFSGPIVDQTGAEKVPAGAVMTDEELLGFNWFVKGVVGTLQ